MAQKLIWTDTQDTGLIRARFAGHSWDSIADALNVSRNAVMERGRRLGARLPPRLAIITEPVEDPDRDPYPAGHPVSWAILTAGTLLQDTPYPPVSNGQGRAGYSGGRC